MSGAPCLIALGSNLGDRRAHLVAAVEAMGRIEGLRLTAASPLYETAPVGGPDDQGAYLNAVIAGSAAPTLTPRGLLEALQAVEAERERVRVVHWGPRTLDLDLLIFGDVRSDDPTLQLPHPRMHERRFVMVPACDVAAEMIHPALGRSLAELLAALPAEPGDIAVHAEIWAPGLGPKKRPPAGRPLAGDATEAGR